MHCKCLLLTQSGHAFDTPTAWTERHSQAGPRFDNLRFGGAAALPIFTFFIFQSEAAWLMFVRSDWCRRLWLRKSARVFHVEEPVMRDLGPIDYFRHLAFPTSYAAAAFSNYPTRVPKGAARVTQRRAIDIGATRRRGNPQRKETGAKAPLDALLVPPIIQQTLMGMGSPENRRKADGSYQAQGVGRGFFCSQLRLRTGGQWLGFLFP